MRKKLIEVALPLEAINAESAREKSIRHGHPSTLHLWWARRPLAACRAVLWASLVDDPSSWPDKFPTDAEQATERQRLFDILGRFETETDKKGATKQVVRGLVSWDDIKNPDVINEAQREIARCLAWERREEPPIQPDAVRDYIARYAPPAYDPFAGGGSIPLEAQRLGLEAHASDLNPVAVLINKALIEIPPRFRDQAPVNPVSRNELLGVRNEDGVQGFDRLAEGYEGGDRRLSADAEVTEGRNLRNAFSNHAGGGLYSSQYSGGVDEGVGQGEGSLSGDRSGLSSGGGDVTNAVRGSGVVPEGSDGSTAGVIGRSESNVNDVAAGEERSEGGEVRSEGGGVRREGGEERREGGEVRSEGGEVRNKTISSQLSPNSSLLTSHFYKGAQGLAADVRYYGEWMREEAFKRIGHLYPKVSSEGGEVRNENISSQLSPNTSLLTVIAWLWARTVTCPNPACGCRMPLVRSFQLSTKKGKEAWVEPIVEGRKEKREGSVDEVSPLTPHSSLLTPRIRFEVKTGKGTAPEGTVERKGAVCLACESPVPLDHVRSEGKAGRMGQQLMAIVAEGQGGRVYLSPTEEQEKIALSAEPSWKPDTELVHNSRHMTPVVYGMTTHGDLFTDRQLVALTTFSDLVTEAKEKAIQDAVAAGLPHDDQPLSEGGTGARAYGEAIAIYLAFATDKASDYWSNLCSWHSSGEKMRNTFGRQAIPMVWDYAECCPFSDSSGNWVACIDWVWKVVEQSPSSKIGNINQHDATKENKNDSTAKLVSTDPPYYDAVPYADLSDFFYVWLRRSVGSIYPDIFGTLLVPKAQEMVADNFRHGSKAKAKEFFETGLTKVFNRVNTITHQNYPFTVYYALKQTESDSDDQIASTGWETILEGLMQANFSIGGTWPLRTELSNRMRGQGSNALASSIVLVCRPRPADAPKTSRRQFIKELEQQLPKALKTLQQGNIAPVDLAQASIGPGMAIYSQYAAVLENDGSPLTVRTALQLINQQLDQFLTEQEGEFDSDTRWALIWFEQYQFNPGPYGEAELLSKAKVTSVEGLVNAGILEAKAGKVRLLPREEIGQKKGNRKEGIGNSENPVTSSLSSIPPNAPHWFLTQVLIHALDKTGETGAADLLAKLGAGAEIAKDLAYRLYNLCDRKGWTQEAISYNSLVISWPEISRLANESQSAPEQMSFL